MNVMKKFKEILTKEDLVSYFEGKKFDLINIESSIVKERNILEDLQEKFKNQLSITDKKKTALSDAIFSEIIYKTFYDLDNRDLADVRFWQWLSLEYLQEYIWNRWWISKNFDKSKSLPSTNDEKIKLIRSTSKEEIDIDIWSPITVRFLGGTSLKSLTSRQAISRLFWPYKILETTELVTQCFEKQDIAVAVFERQFGLHPDAAKAFIKNISLKHKNLDKKSIQTEAKKLNRYFATISPDYLNQDEIKDLLFE